MDNNIKMLVELRRALRLYLDPQVLGKLVEFVESTGGDNSMIEKYVWFSENSEDKEECKYAIMAKDFFEKKQAGQIARAINWLYHNWSHQYE